MKKLLVLFVCLFSVLSLQAADNFEFVDYVYYDSTTGKDFSYHKDFSYTGYYGIEFNLPFASKFSISGMTVDFTITNEDFKWFVINDTENDYVDFYLNFDTKTHLGWYPENYIENYITKIVRCYFKR